MKGKVTLIIFVIFAVQAIILGTVVHLSGRQAAPAYTPIPVIPAATLPAASAPVQEAEFGIGDCQIATLDLIGSWVAAGKPEFDAFTFNGIDGKKCTGSFETTILPLFIESNIWHPGAIACSSCHGEIGSSPAQLNLKTYADIMAGSRRANAGTVGEDILGDATTWEKSKLYIQIITRQMPFGAPPDTPQRGPIVRAGTAE